MNSENTDFELEPGLRVRPIENGTVIDHINAGQALNVLHILKLPGQFESVVSVLINSPSKYGKKDVVKIENRELKVKELDKISLIAPSATINIIRDFKVLKKNRVKIPEYVEGVVQCVNPNCISNSSEPITSKFSVYEEDNIINLRCIYCERIISEDIADHLLRE
ncbi:aspartate carbamoyltransferase regulatory subunit [uncultured Methanomethylovorans sp.]|uniref:aspartate carbamoyltransferase regulatory subunit n=1 Tax=uncultured Methanomethylovorans sp. TaxID=183759 RepID=UPI002601A7B6|nr:aspartate carbamoyltransferase regulatory subunit [uncultured Methanomethylovorans sp.]